MFEYKMVQVPPTINVGTKEKGSEAASYLQNVVNESAVDGWEFYRVDNLGVKTSPGCLGALSGQKDQTLIYYVVTFRKSRNV